MELPIPHTQRKRKICWSSDSDGASCPKYMNHLSLEQTEILLIRLRIEEITREIQQHKTETPFPQITYSEQSRKFAHNDLLLERHEVIQLALNIDPTIQVPSDYTPYQRKVSNKIRIPKEKYPDYNFIGLVIGPRGLTQRRIEKDHSCKLFVLGHGSARKVHYDEPLHVLVVADTEAQLLSASSVIKKLLVPVETDEHKRSALRSLSSISGPLQTPTAMHSYTYIPPWAIETASLAPQQVPVQPISDDEYQRFMDEISSS